MAACSSLTYLPLQCASEALIGGTSKVYAIAAKDLGTVSGGTLSYAVSPTTGAVTDIALLVPATGFVEIGQLKNVAGLGSEFTKNANGTNYFTTTATMQLTGLTPENYKFIDSVRNQPVAFIYQSRQGNYYAAGLGGTMEIATVTSNTGIAESDLVGYTLTFTGVDSHGERFVEASAAQEVITSP
jgi:hypothetical protein